MLWKGLFQWVVLMSKEDIYALCT